MHYTITPLLIQGIQKKIRRAPSWTNAGICAIPGAIHHSTAAAMQHEILMARAAALTRQAVERGTASFGAAPVRNARMVFTSGSQIGPVFAHALRKPQTGADWHK